MGRPILFRAGSWKTLAVTAPLAILVADSGEPSDTAAMVARVAEARDAEPATYDMWLDHMQTLVDKAVRLLAEGDSVTLGRTLDQYHLVLQAMKLSTTRLDLLVDAARSAGALGAKLTGAGGGGSVVVLPRWGDEKAVDRALHSAGATNVLASELQPDPVAA
jgi:mevalonate kinase